MELRSNCPECIHRKGSEDTGKHLYWNSEKSAWFCFRCGYAGKGVCPVEGGTEHRKFPGIKLSPNPEKLIDLLNAGSGSLRVTAAIRYLEKHHLDPMHVAYRFGLLLDGNDLVFPVYRGSEMIYYQKRNLFSKIFTNPDVETKPLFWVETNPLSVVSVIVVESWINAVRLEYLHDSVALFGKFLSDEGAEEIKNKTDYARILLDAGEKEHALKIARKLRQLGVKSSIINIRGSHGTDVCDFDNRQVTRMFG